MSAAALALLAAAVGSADEQNVTAPAGVENAQRAWQHWTLNCQGCHRPDGTGPIRPRRAWRAPWHDSCPAPGGREYLSRVPGVAASALSDADLAEVMNWMLWRFDKEHLPADFQPYTAAEIGQLRTRPLRLEASQMRADLLKKADASIAR